MVISIDKMKAVIEELHVIEKKYKQQADAFETILQNYRSLTEEGTDRRTMQKILDGMQKEIRSLQGFKRCLKEIVRQYEQTEMGIIRFSEADKPKNTVFQRINTETARQILDQYHINIK